MATTADEVIEILADNLTEDRNWTEAQMDKFYEWMHANGHFVIDTIIAGGIRHAEGEPQQPTT